MTSLSLPSTSSAPLPERRNPSVRRWRLIFRLSDASGEWIGMTVCLVLAIYWSSGSLLLSRSTQAGESRDRNPVGRLDDGYCVRWESSRGRRFGASRLWNWNCRPVNEAACVRSEMSAWEGGTTSVAVLEGPAFGDRTRGCAVGVEQVPRGRTVLGGGVVSRVVPARVSQSDSDRSAGLARWAARKGDHARWQGVRRQPS